MDIAIAVLRLVVGLSLAAIAFGVIQPYFTRPEEFFVKRLRPKKGRRYTHTELLVRAFLGAGLLTSGAWILGYFLVAGIVTDRVPGTPTLWLVATLGASLLIGSAVYAYLRFCRYRIVPRGGGYFALRKP